MAEGETARHVIVIVSGWTRITVEENEGERLIAERGPGQLIGERGALRVNVRSATVTALNDVRAMLMKTEDFASFITAHPRVLDVVENQIYDRLVEEPEEPAQDRWPDQQDLQQGKLVRGRDSGPTPLSGENCTVIVTDVIGFGAHNRTDLDRQIIRRKSLEMMQESFGSLWGLCIFEDRGDGLLVIVPPQVPTARIIEIIHRRLPAKLRLHNRTYAETAQIRLRAAVNVGPVVSDMLGLSGEAIIRTARLVEAPILKKSMAATDAELGVMVSDFVYDTVVRHIAEFVQAERYQEVEVKVKEFRSSARMRLINASENELSREPH
jgi:class 3 adenylate cyclase